MARSSQPTLFLLAGPNGAGKSTLYADRIKPKTSAPFVNADLILEAWQAERGGASPDDAYAASKEAAAQREQLISERRSFVSETVFSHPSKLTLIQRALDAGYRVVLFHVNVRHADFSVARVAARVIMGGHPVPEDKIRERYDRNPALIREAANLATVTHVYDNSRVGQPPRWLLTLERGEVVRQCRDKTLPDWAEALYF